MRCQYSLVPGDADHHDDAYDHPDPQRNSDPTNTYQNPGSTTYKDTHQNSFESTAAYHHSHQVHEHTQDANENLYSARAQRDANRSL